MGNFSAYRHESGIIQVDQYHGVRVNEPFDERTWCKLPSSCFSLHVCNRSLAPRPHTLTAERQKQPLTP